MDLHARNTVTSCGRRVVNMLGPKRLLLWFLLISIIAADEASSLVSNKTIRIGYLVVNINSAGAINVAIRNAQNDGLMRDYNVRYNLNTF